MSENISRQSLIITFILFLNLLFLSNESLRTYDIKDSNIYTQ